MKYNTQDTAEVTFINKKTGENDLTMNTVSTPEITSSSINAVIPRKFSIKNIEGSKELFEQSLPFIGKTLIVESEIVNGLFSLSLEDNEIVCTEVL